MRAIGSIYNIKGTGVVLNETCLTVESIQIIHLFDMDKEM